jgi:hypothetical protein
VTDWCQNSLWNVTWISLKSSSRQFFGIFFPNRFLPAFIRLPRKTIPVFMWRNSPTTRALRFMPMSPATGTHTRGPEGMPRGSATRDTPPTIIGLGAVLAFWTQDFGFFCHRFRLCLARSFQANRKKVMVMKIYTEQVL